MLNSDLTRVFKSAGRIRFDDSSRLVFFGDCHRGDGGWADEFADNRHIFCEALAYYGSRDYTYIELGDGDDLWKHGNFDAIRHAHWDVFCLLREFHASGRLHLIWGNHNRVWKRPERDTHRSCGDYATPDIYAALFDGIEVHEGLIIQHTQTGYQLFATHGHQVDLLSQRLWRLSKFCVGKPWKLLQWLGAKDPTVAAGYRDRPGALEHRLQNWVANYRQPIICGHTHRPAFPRRADETAYFNVGTCLYPGYITGIEIQYGQAMLVRWSPQSAPGPAAGRVVREMVAPVWRLRDA